MAGQGLLSDVMHIPGGGLGFLVVGGVVVWLGRTSKPRFTSPTSVDGWLERCNTVLDQFESFEADVNANERRRESLQAVIERSGPKRLAMVTVEPSCAPDTLLLQEGLSSATSLQLSLCRPLVSTDGHRQWPDVLQNHDVILFSVSNPVMAAELLWLQQVPTTQPTWLLVHASEDESDDATIANIAAVLPERWRDRVVLIGDDGALRASLAPLRRSLSKGLPDARHRLLEALHRDWQADLERLRRNRFQQLQQRTQWIVAGSVLVSPIPSLDLLAVAVANGLMLKEMGDIWGAEVKSDVLREAASHLARAALAQGVVEWTSQTLLGLAKLEAGSWLAAGVMQSLSAAYLTRVVGRSMADWLAVNAGVSEPDLASLKREAPLLIARAAEEERLDWPGFLQQSRQWALNTTS